MATALVTLATAVACSVTPSYSAPKSFTVGNDAVAQVVHDAIAGDTWRTQMDGSPTVDCSGQTSCTISYTVKQPTSGNDLDLIEPTRQMWKAFFADPQFQSGTIHVSDPATTSGGKSHTAHYYTLTCDRNAASQIDWDNVDGKGIRTLCDYTPQIKDMPGFTPLPGGDLGG